MRHLKVIRDERGFSLTELMLAMTILAIGLLALAQMQVMALQGTTSSRQFSIATNLARETIAAVKMPGVFFEDSKTGTITRLSPILVNTTSNNDADGGFYWPVTTDTDIDKFSLAAGSRPFMFDFIEVLTEGAAGEPFTRTCVNLLELDHPPKAWPETCIANELADGDYVRVINVRNIPSGQDEADAIMKEVNVIVLWKERNRTRSVSMVTLVGRKSSAFI